MKKIVRITESEINNIVKRVLNENISQEEFELYQKLRKDEYKQKKLKQAEKFSKEEEVGIHQFGEILNTLLGMGFPLGEATEILRDIYEKSEKKNLAEDAKKNPNIKYEGDIKQIVDDIEEMFDNNGFHIDAELIVNNDMSPDYLDSVEEVERALEDGEIDGNGIMQMVCDFLEIKYDEKIEVESQIDIIYVYEKGNRDEGAALVIDIENEL